jgi:hypothetical protein
MLGYRPWIVWLSLSLLSFGSPAVAQSPQPPAGPGAQSSVPDAQATAASLSEQLPHPQSLGRISGTVVDQSGAVVAGVLVRLSREEQSPDQEVLSDGDGQFSFASVTPGPFRLTISSSGFATQSSSGNLQPGESCLIPQFILAVAIAITEVRVIPSRIDLAEDQIKNQEKQRVLGVIPNFYVSYENHALPLAPRQKFELAWKTSVDPVTFGVNGIIAGIQQARNDFSGYGQGSQGYAKRYASSYADFVAGTFIGSAILPSLLKQDPRYFYKGNGSRRSRILYALANSVICKGDDGHWQANYSNIIGSLAAGGISNLYYPAKNRNDAGLTFENALIGMGESAAINLFQEFFIRKLTPNVPSHEPAGHQSQSSATAAAATPGIPAH